MTDGLKKCYKCGEEFPEEKMYYCEYCGGYYCYSCSLVHPDLNPERNQDYPNGFEEAPDPSYYDEEDNGDD